jgi:hypothetical protein
MVFYVIFWTTYLPFVLLTLSLLADRLTHHTAPITPGPMLPRRRSRFPSLRSLRAARARTPARPSDVWPSDLAE